MDYGIFRMSSGEDESSVEAHVLARAYRAAWRVKNLADHTRALIDATPGLVVRDNGCERCGIVSLEAAGQNPGGLVAQMREKGFAIGTSSPSSTRIDFEKRGLPVLIRIAPHYYNTEDEITACVDTLGGFVRTAA